MSNSVQREQRNLEEEGLERDRYIVLLHVYTLTWVGPTPSLTSERIIQDLGFTRSRGNLILHGLMLEEYLQYATTGEGVVLTRRGVDYIEHAAGRRHSLRLMR
jgi:hypothetical protein